MPVAVIRRQALLLALVNLAAAVSFGLLDWGSAASVVLLQQIAPLPVWGVAHAVVAVLFTAGRYVPAHFVAVPLWAMWAAGAVLGLVEARTTSQAGSVMLAAMVAVLAGQHFNGMAWRRRTPTDHAVREAGPRRDP